MGERRVQNVEALEQVLSGFAKGGGIAEFLGSVDNTGSENAAGSVKLLTIHSAKGLEFDTVFIVGTTDGMIPYYKNTSPAEVEEERRMFYVAITRAKNHLYAQICAFQFWKRYGEDRNSAWSDYLKLCRAGGSLSFVELINLSGLISPFEPGCVKAVAGQIAEWLDGFDDSGL